MTDVNEKGFRNAKICHVCRKEFVEHTLKNNNKVRDHCNITGKYRGAGHNLMQFKLQIQK